MSAHFVALAEWAWLVRENGLWDHKPAISSRFKPADPKASAQHWHHYDGFLYYYDIWSNIHYGYVGRTCGFTSGELLDGAGLDQTVSELVEPSGCSSRSFAP